MTKNLSVIGLALFAIGCATQAPLEPEQCEPVCEMVETCEPDETCKPVLVEVGTKLVCDVQTVNIVKEICNVYEDEVVTCSTGDVPYSAVVSGSTVVNYTETDCSTSQVPYSETVTGTGSITYTQTECATEDVTQNDTVCVTDSCDFVDTECEEQLSDLSGETCEDLLVTQHRLVNFETAADGNLIPAGAWGETVSLAYQEWAGLEISVTNYDGSESSRDLATFDSLFPTGGDWDLGTVNSYWGGPGSGSGGWDTNFFERGNLLIHAEDLGDSDGDGLLDDPDDYASGARFHFDFDTTVCIEGLTVVDLEPNENGYLRMFDASGSEILNQQIIGLGNNSAQVLDPNVCGVASVVFELCGSGAVDDLRFSYEEAVETCLPWQTEQSTLSCTETPVSEPLEVCTEHTFTCSETACEETTVTEEVTTQTDFAWTCNETTCLESPVSLPVATETNFAYTCEETECTTEVVLVDVCETHIVSDEVNVCVEVPDEMAGLQCDKEPNCTDVEVCDYSNCDPEDEWLTGGGFPGSR